MRGGGMMRRRGPPLLMPVGGLGGGMGSLSGAPLLNLLLAGGLGYWAGSGTAKQTVDEQQQSARIAQLEQQQAAPPPYQAPPAAAPTPPAPPAASTETDRLAQLRLLAQLHESGVLTDAEFEAEKQKILRSS